MGTGVAVFLGHRLFLLLNGIISTPSQCCKCKPLACACGSAGPSAVAEVTLGVAAEGDPGSLSEGEGVLVPFLLPLVM